MKETNKIEIVLNQHAGNGTAQKACRKVTSFLKKSIMNMKYISLKEMATVKELLDN